MSLEHSYRDSITDLFAIESMDFLNKSSILGILHSQG